MFTGLGTSVALACAARVAANAQIAIDPARLLIAFMEPPFARREFGQVDLGFARNALSDWTIDIPTDMRDAGQVILFRRPMSRSWVRHAMGWPGDGVLAQSLLADAPVVLIRQFPG